MQTVVYISLYGPGSLCRCVDLVNIRDDFVSEYVIASFQRRRHCDSPLAALSDQSRRGPHLCAEVDPSLGNFDPLQFGFVDQRTIAIACGDVGQDWPIRVRPGVWSPRERNGASSFDRGRQWSRHRVLVAINIGRAVRIWGYKAVVEIFCIPVKGQKISLWQQYNGTSGRHAYHAAILGNVPVFTLS